MNFFSYFNLGIFFIIIGIFLFACTTHQALIKTTVIPALCVGCPKVVYGRGPDRFHPIFEYEMNGKRYTSRSLLFVYRKKSLEFANGTWHYIWVDINNPNNIFHRALTIWDHIFLYSVCLLMIVPGIALVVMYAP